MDFTIRFLVRIFCRSFSSTRSRLEVVLICILYILAESEEVQEERQTEGKGLKWTVHSCIYGIAKYRVYIASLNNESQDGGIKNKSNHPHDKEYDVFPSPIPKKMMQLAFSNNQVAIQTNKKCLQ